MSQRVCRCEATIAAIVLDAYACGRPDCWRTAEAQAAFDAFVADLVRERQAGPGAGDTSNPPSAGEPTT